MGGSGSGNHYHWWRPGKKATVEASLNLDANRWRREDIFRADSYRSGSWQWTYPGGNSFTVHYEVNTLDLSAPHVRLWYSLVWGGEDQPQSADYRVLLTVTRPRFGGLRWWFLCPLTVRGWPCNRRVGKLYLPPYGRHFGCRHCHKLTYRSCQESHKHDSLVRLLVRDTDWDFATARRVMNGISRRR